MYGEKRHDFRLNSHRVVVYLDLKGAYSGMDGVRKPTPCNAKNVSASGVKIEIDRSVRRGATLNLWVELPDIAEKYALVGEVRWCFKLEHQRYGVGVELDDTKDSDIAAWKSCIARLLVGK